LAGFVTGCKPQGTSAFTAHISLTYGVYLVFHLSGAIPLPAFKKRNHAVLCLRGEIGVHGPHHKDTKAQRKFLGRTIPTQFSEEPNDNKRSDQRLEYGAHKCSDKYMFSRTGETAIIYQLQLNYQHPEFGYCGTGTSNKN